MTRALKTPISSAEDSHWAEDLIHLRIERCEASQSARVGADAVG